MTIPEPLSVTLTIQARIDDRSALFAQAVSRATEAFGSSDFWPESPQAALFEAAIASNSWPSPDMIGLAYDQPAELGTAKTGFDADSHIQLTIPVDIDDPEQLIEHLELEPARCDSAQLVAALRDQLQQEVEALSPAIALERLAIEPVTPARKAA